MNRFCFTSTPLAGLIRVERLNLEDHRGFLSRIFCAEEFSSAGINISIAQINHTFTIKTGTIRGMHYQLTPFTEMKLVSCIRGSVFDVAIDLRADSPTFMRWYSEILSLNNRYALAIPPGFAHGFQTLEDNCELLYTHSSQYRPNEERSINPTDPMLSINWPIKIGEMSDRDRKQEYLKNDFRGIVL